MNRLFLILYDWLLCQIGFTGDFSRLTFNESDVGLVGIALRQTTACTAHAGIVYRTLASSLRFLHFANHETLRDDPCAGRSRYVYAIPLLKSEDEEFLAGFCERVFRANQDGKLPYSFEFDPNLGFDRETGLAVLNHRIGFTCSTFVVALFRSAGNPLVQPITWPRTAGASDIAARRYVLNAWRQSGPVDLRERADEIEPTIRTMRIGPEQVAGACLQGKLPTGYYRADANGRRILQRFTDQFGPPGG